jgi:Ca2+-binding RTX toxin-like protein
MSKRQRRKREKLRRHEPSERPDRLGRQLAAGAGVTVGATLLMGGVAQAACTCSVDSLADPTDPPHTTLRDAMVSADANPGSTISFASGLSGTITLDSQLPAINYPTIIQGPGASQLTVSGDDSSRPFYLNGFDGAQATTISGLTITGGAASVGAGVLSNNMDLTLTGVTLSDNHATESGGGIQAAAGGSLTIVDSTISGNTASGGAGLYTFYGSGTPTTIRSSTISGNNALPGVFAGNFGGAYFDYSSSALVENSTIYGNTAAGRGGGLHHDGREGGGPGLTVRGSTISHNSAGTRGGGVASNGDPTDTQPTFENTIIAGNSAPTGPDVSANDGSMNAAFSLIQAPDPSTTINQTGPDIFSLDAQLGPLAGNGGPTQTQKPLPSSPVLDRGAAFGLTADQRGSGRPFDIPSLPNAAGGDGSDIGAVELQASETPVPAAAPPTCKGKPATIVGTNGNDTRKGTSGKDVIAGLGGKDKLSGLAGNDLICGGAGKDTLNGGKGNDKLYGEAGKDTLKGGPGKDKLKGGAGKDKQIQ